MAWLRGSLSRPTTARRPRRPETAHQSSQPQHRPSLQWPRGHRPTTRHRRPPPQRTAPRVELPREAGALTAVIRISLAPLRVGCSGMLLERRCVSGSQTAPFKKPRSRENAAQGWTRVHWHSQSSSVARSSRCANDRANRDEANRVVAGAPCRCPERDRDETRGRSKSYTPLDLPTSVKCLSQKTKSP